MHVMPLHTSLKYLEDGASVKAAQKPVLIYIRITLLGQINTNKSTNSQLTVAAYKFLQLHY